MEIWKSLIYNSIDYGNKYIISNYGNIKSLKYNRILKPHLSHGYYQVNLSLGSRHNIKRIYVHRAVACTFISNIQNLPQVNHKDGIKTNNYAGTPESNFVNGNLEWCSGSYNVEHSLVNKLQKSGDMCSYSKLTKSDVIYIKTNYKRNSKYYNTISLSKKFNVDRTTISKIINNHRWKYI